MTEDEILAEFRAADALLEGHFILSSGLHSPRYLQCARVLMDPKRAARLASAIVATMPRTLRSRIEIVVSPAMGGIIAGHEVARALSSREAMKAIAEAGGEVVAAAALVDRSGGTADLGVPFYPLIRLSVPT